MDFEKLYYHRTHYQVYKNLFTRFVETHYQSLISLHGLGDIELEKLINYLINHFIQSFDIYVTNNKKRIDAPLLVNRANREFSYEVVGNIIFSTSVFGKPGYEKGQAYKNFIIAKDKIDILDFYSSSTRIRFRTVMTLCLLGYYYNFNFKKFCYTDGTIGQEVIYHLLHEYIIYNLKIKSKTISAITYEDNYEENKSITDYQEYIIINPSDFDFNFGDSRKITRMARELNAGDNTQAIRYRYYDSKKNIFFESEDIIDEPNIVLDGLIINGKYYPNIYKA